MSQHPPATSSDLQRVYLLWRERSAPRWHALLGDDAGDLLSEVWLRLERTAGYRHTSDQATLRYIEVVADYVRRDLRRASARRSALMTTALELGARGLTADINRVTCLDTASVDISAIIDAAELTRSQRIVIVGLRHGMDRQAIAEQLGVTMETVREHERAAIVRMREAAKGARK